MQSLGKLNIYNIRQGNTPYIIISTMLIMSVVLCLFLFLGVNLNYSIILLGMSVLSVLILNFHSIFFLIIISLFVKDIIIFYTLSHYIVPFLILSYAICRQTFDLKALNSRLIYALFIYLAIMFVSLINTSSIIRSLLYFYNYFNFLILIFIIAFAYKETEELKKYFYFFALLVLLNSLHVIFLALTSGKRSFGFGGIMFVDYVALALVICINLVFFARSWKRNVLLILIAIFTIAMLFTQTRGVWIASTCSVLFILCYYLIKKNMYVKRSAIIVFFISFALILSVSYMVFGDVLLTATKDRIENSAFIDEGQAAKGEVSNSLLTRIFIWHTAYNAYKAHPIIGIGAYSFSFSSGFYYTIPKIFYIKYVRYLSPHETFLEVLTETGIVGLIAFFVLLYSIIKLSFESISRSSYKDHMMYSTTMLASNIYVICSMLVTDAWLWGHGIILWGMIVGATLTNYNATKINLRLNRNEE